MIATRRLFFRGRKLELELRVHVFRPEPRDAAKSPTDAERVAGQGHALRKAEQRRAHWQRIWLEQGSRW